MLKIGSDRVDEIERVRLKLDSDILVLGWVKLCHVPFSLELEAMQGTFEAREDEIVTQGPGTSDVKMTARREFSG